MSIKIEIALEVVRKLIDVSINEIQSEPNNQQAKDELHQLYGVENLIEQAEEFLYEEKTNDNQRINRLTKSN